MGSSSCCCLGAFVLLMILSGKVDAPGNEDYDDFDHDFDDYDYDYDNDAGEDRLAHDHPSAISFFWIHTILHDILRFDTIITRY